MIVERRGAAQAGPGAGIYNFRQQYLSVNFTSDTGSRIRVELEVHVVDATRKNAGPCTEENAAGPRQHLLDAPTD